MTHYDDGIKFVSDGQTAYFCGCGEDFRLRSDLEDHLRRKREEDEADAVTTMGVLGALTLADTPIDTQIETPTIPDSTGDSTPSVDPAPDFGGFGGGESGGGGASGDF